MSTRRTNRFSRNLRLLLPVLLIFFAARAAFAAVTLIYFLAETETDKVRLEWETATELDNAGFAVLRNQTGGSDPGQYALIPVIDATSGVSYTFIPARGDDLVGALYVFHDENVTIGTRYYYLLQDVDSNNASSYHGPEEAVAGQTPTPTLAATQTATPTRTNTPGGPSATPTRTRTPTPITPTAASIQVTPISTFTPTPSPIPPSTQEGPTATFDPQVPSFDLTLTAVYASVTELPTASPSQTPIEIAAAASPTGTPGATMTATATEEAAANENPALTGRLIPIILVVLVSGGLLTWGILLIARRSAG